MRGVVKQNDSSEHGSPEKYKSRTPLRLYTLSEDLAHFDGFCKSFQEVYTGLISTSVSYFLDFFGRKHRSGEDVAIGSTLKVLNCGGIAPQSPYTPASSCWPSVLSSGVDHYHGEPTDCQALGEGEAVGYEDFPGSPLALRSACTLRSTFGSAIMIVICGNSHPSPSR